MGEAEHNAAHPRPRDAERHGQRHPGRHGNEPSRTEPSGNTPSESESSESESSESESSGNKPSIGAAIGLLGTAGRESLSAGADTLHALRRLVAADLALARVALVRALVWLALGVAFGASGWMLLMTAGIALLHRLGLSWLTSISLMTALSLVITAIAGWMTLHYFNLGKLDATRRQLARLGIGGGEDDASEDTETPGTSPRTAGHPTERAG